MRVLILSDLHIDVNGYSAGDDYKRAVEKHEPDVIICAGDVYENPTRSIHFLDEAARNTPTLFVAGNHEWYGHDMRRDVRSAEDAADKSTNVFWLNNTSTVINDVLFTGGTLWTDFMLNGAADRHAAMRTAEKGMNDYRYIRFDGKKLCAYNTADEFEDTYMFIHSSLTSAEHRKKVVVTHHAPCAKSVSPGYIGSPLNPAFVSNIPELVEKADVWVHGHVHHFSDYSDKDTRIVCNPYGYTRHDPVNPHASGYVITI